MTSLKNKHKAELDYETTALKKDKEETVQVLTDKYEKTVSGLLAEHETKVKTMNSDFELKIANKEASHAKVLEQLETERN